LRVLDGATPIAPLLRGEGQGIAERSGAQLGFPILPFVWNNEQLTIPV